jgi:hypothetical protein
MSIGWERGQKTGGDTSIIMGLSSFIMAMEPCFMHFIPSKRAASFFREEKNREEPGRDKHDNSMTLRFQNCSSSNILAHSQTLSMLLCL